MRPIEFNQANQISLENSGLKIDDVKTYEIKPILEDAMGHVKINEQLIREIEQYVKSYMNKDEEHISFFGSNLTGVNKIVFTTDDRNTWCIDILDMDEAEVRKRVKNLPHIGSTWVRGTDGMNLSLIYLSYLIHNSKLNDKLKTEGIVNCMIILQIKFLSSLMYAYFKFPVAEELALQVYNELSRKYYIKKYGTWYALMRARGEDIYTKGGMHWQVIESFTTDERIQRMITDIQTRIKSMILNIYEVTVNLNQKGKRVGSDSLLGNVHGKIEVKDIEKNFDNYQLYIKSIITEPNAFVKRELVELISASITTMPEKLLYDLLGVIVQMSRDNDKQLNEMVDEILIFTFDYFRENRRDVKDLSNLGRLITNLKALFTASKTNNPIVLRLRDYFDKLVKKNVKSKNPATISGVRTGIVLYIVLRTLTKNHFG